MMGLLLPFVTSPKTLIGQHVVLGVDNTSVVYGWQKRYSRNDPETSLLIRVLHVIEAYLQFKIYVTHVRRMSTKHAALADALSREATTEGNIRAAMAGVPIHRPWEQLGRWLESPVLDWDLPLKILADVKTQCT
jgi:hypothetical protein